MIHLVTIPVYLFNRIVMIAVEWCHLTVPQTNKLSYYQTISLMD